MTMTRWGDLVYAERTRHRLTRRVVAEVAHCHKRSIWFWEMGKWPLSESRARQLLDAIKLLSEGKL